MLKQGREIEKSLMVPPTFDQMMTEFGQRVLHKQIDQECSDATNTILNKPVPATSHELGAQIEQNANLFMRLYESSNCDAIMTSLDN
jgi:hypothetical protein